MGWMERPERMDRQESLGLQARLEPQELLVWTALTASPAWMALLGPWAFQEHLEPWGLQGWMVWMESLGLMAPLGSVGEMARLGLWDLLDSTEQMGRTAMAGRVPSGHRV